MLVLILTACSDAEERPTATSVLHEVLELPPPPAAGTPETSFAVEAVWSVPLGGAVNVAPTISGDLAIVATANGQIRAVEAATGVSAWNFSPDEKIWDASLVAGEGYVCAGQQGGRVTCLDAKTGQQLWTRELGLEVQSRPALADKVLYVPTTLVGTGIEADFAGQAILFALDATTGEELWQTVTGNYILRRPIVAGDLVITGGAYQPENEEEDREPTRIYAFNLADGEQRWVHEAEDGLLRWLAATEVSVAYSASSEIVRALNLANGELLWSFGPSYWMQFPAATADRLYFGTGDEVFWSLDAATGEVLWERQIELSNLNQIGRPIVNGDLVHFNSVTGDIYSLRLSDGQQVTHLKTGYSSRVGGAQYEALYIMGDPDGNLRAFEIR